MENEGRELAQRETPIILDEPPLSLVRVFDDVRWRDEFIRGAIRLSAPQAFRNFATGTRHDSSEGEGQLRVAGEVPFVTIDTDRMRQIGEGFAPGCFNYGQLQVHAVYSLSFSRAIVATKELGKFGNHAVRIRQPAELVRRLALAAQQHSRDEVVVVEGFPIRYDKGAVGERPSGKWASRLAYGQKDERYAGEMEFRVAIVTYGVARSSPVHWSINIGSIDDIAEPFEF